MTTQDEIEKKIAEKYLWGYPKDNRVRHNSEIHKAISEAYLAGQKSHITTAFEGNWDAQSAVSEFNEEQAMILENYKWRMLKGMSPENINVASHNGRLILAIRDATKIAKAQTLFHTIAEVESPEMLEALSDLARSEQEKEHYRKYTRLVIIKILQKLQALQTCEKGLNENTASEGADCDDDK